MIATAATTRNAVLVMPIGLPSPSAIDKAMKVNREKLGYWTTVMPPIRRLTKVHRRLWRRLGNLLLGGGTLSDVMVQPQGLKGSQAKVKS
jgi:hypothetical protein